MSEGQGLRVLGDLSAPARVDGIEPFGGGIDDAQTVLQLPGECEGWVLGRIGCSIDRGFCLEERQGLLDLPCLFLMNPSVIEGDQEREEGVAERRARRESAGDLDERASALLASCSVIPLEEMQRIFALRLIASRWAALVSSVLPE